MRDYNLWMGELVPVFLVMYDATARVGYWLYVQQHFADARRRPKPGRKSVRVAIPRANVVGEALIRHARACKLLIQAQLSGKARHDAE